MKALVGGAASGSTDDKRTWTVAHSFHEAWGRALTRLRERIVAVRLA